MLQVWLVSGRYLSLQCSPRVSLCQKKLQLVVEELSNSTEKLGGCGFTSGNERKKQTGLRYTAQLEMGGYMETRIIGFGGLYVENRIIGLGWMDAFSQRVNPESAQNIFTSF